MVMALLIQAENVLTENNKESYANTAYSYEELLDGEYDVDTLSNSLNLLNTRAIYSAENGKLIKNQKIVERDYKEEAVVALSLANPLKELFDIAFENVLYNDQNGNIDLPITDEKEIELVRKEAIKQVTENLRSGFCGWDDLGEMANIICGIVMRWPNKEPK